MDNFDDHPEYKITHIPYGRRISFTFRVAKISYKNENEITIYAVLNKRVTSPPYLFTTNCGIELPPLKAGFLVHLHPEEPEDIAFALLYGEAP